MYIMENRDGETGALKGQKVSARGIQSGGNKNMELLTVANYTKAWLSVLNSAAAGDDSDELVEQTDLEARNSGIRQRDQSMLTYRLKRKGLRPFSIKRPVVWDERAEGGEIPQFTTTYSNI
jgi:hypothetical protein